MIRRDEPGGNGSRWREPTEWSESEPERDWPQPLVGATVSFLSAIGRIWLLALIVAGLGYLVLWVWELFRGFTR